MNDATILETGLVFVAGEPHYLRLEAMRRLKRDRTTLWRWSKSGRITQRIHNGRACYPVVEVHELVAELKKETAHVVGY